MVPYNKYYGYRERTMSEEKCVQVGSNPAVLNEPDGQDKYTVCHGMSTSDLESWGEKDEST